MADYVIYEPFDDNIRFVSMQRVRVSVVFCCITHIQESVAQHLWFGYTVNPSERCTAE